MKLFADTANLEQLRELKEMGIVSGVTTNPSIAATRGSDFRSTLKSICEIFPTDPVLGQVTEGTAERIVEQALRIGDVAENIVVKIPASDEGLKAIARLKAKNRRVCATTVVTSAQALLAGLAGADYVAPYVGEWDIIGYKGFDALEEIVTMFRSADIHAEVLAAAILNAHDIVEVAKRGTDILTITYETILSVVKMPKPIIDFYVNRFHADWNGANCHI